MPKSVSFTDPYAQEYAELARKQKLAEILGQQAIEPAGNTEMVSGWAVPQGPLQGLSKVAQAGLSAYMMNKTGEREKMLAEKIRESGKKDASDFIGALQGTAAKPSTYQADTFDEADKAQLAMDMGTPAVAGDKQKALAIALGSGNPMVQGAGSTLMADMLKGKAKPIVLGKTLVDPETYEPVAVDQTWQADQAAARAQKIEELNMRLQDQRLNREEQAQLRRELAAQQEAMRRDLAAQASADRRAIAEQSRADRRAATEQGSKPPTGYRYTPQGNLEAIPGGPADIKAGELGDKRAKQREMLATQATNVLGAIGDAKKLVGYSTTGVGGLLRNVPMTDARNLEAKLTTIKANLGFDRLQQMRDSSPTGGALGQVAVQELVALQATIASLDQLQSPKELKGALEKIETHYTNWQKTIEQDAAGGGESPAGKVKRFNPATGRIE